MIRLNLLETPEAEELRRCSKNFVIIGVPHDTEFDFLRHLIDFRRIVPDRDDQNWISLIEPCLELPKTIEFLRKRKPDLVLLSTIFDHGIFYCIREAIGDQALLIAFSTFGVSDQHRAILLEYVNGIIERSKRQNALCEIKSVTSLSYWDWLYQRAKS